MSLGAFGRIEQESKFPEEIKSIEAEKDSYLEYFVDDHFPIG